MEPGREASRRIRSAPLEDLFGTAAYPRALARGGAVLTAVGAGGILVGVLLPGPHREEIPFGSVVGLLVLALLGAGGLWRWGPSWSARSLRWVAVVVAAGIAGGVAVLGPSRSESAAAIAGMAGPMFFFLPRRQACEVLAVALAGYAVALALDDGYTSPATRWLMVAGVSAASGIVMSWIADRIRRLAAAERTASSEVARLNDVLAGRIDDLGRFLPTHVAELVRDAGDRTALEPHRRQVAIMFVDLRGFTAFTAGAEPEDVVEVLGEYYAAVGDVATAHGGTTGAFVGDAVMAYFGDPLERVDPAGDALAVAVALRPSLDALAADWADRGFKLGYGIGIAYGYATLGVVGYESRRDYTALGTVVNLAARLCAEAGPGEILLDPRAWRAVQGAATSRPRDLRLKGFTEAVRAHALEMAPRRST